MLNISNFRPDRAFKFPGPSLLSQWICQMSIYISGLSEKYIGAISGLHFVITSSRPGRALIFSGSALIGHVEIFHTSRP